MDIDDLLVELEAFGIENDRMADDRSKRMFNITRDTGQFLSVLVRATGARRILEVGTSNGYSTLWLARAASANQGMVTTVELLETKIALARENFRRAGLAEFITQIHAQAGDFLTQAASASFDLVFLDSDRSHYPEWLVEVRRLMRPGGTLVADNALTHPEEMAPFMRLIESDPAFTSCLVPVGNGEFMAVFAG